MSVQSAPKVSQSTLVISPRPTINGFTSKASAIRHLRSRGHAICTILAKPESNPKVAKNGKIVDVMTAPMHLAPSWLSGFNVCPQASAGCIAACLHTAGNPAYMSQKETSRITKTQAYFKERDAFLAVLVFEMIAHRTKWTAQGYDVAYRLNATSDLPFERRTVTIDGHTVNIMSLFSDCVFYDYTAITKRAVAWASGKMPQNYHLTFSKKEDNDNDVLNVLFAGGNVAAVASLDVYKASMVSGVVSINGREFACVDGDAHDYRPADKPVLERRYGKTEYSGVVVLLKAKGDAKTDTSGFVIRVQ
jgi:hypothetical protein